MTNLAVACREPRDLIIHMTPRRDAFAPDHDPILRTHEARRPERKHTSTQETSFHNQT